MPASAAAVVASFVWFFSKWREPGLPGLLLAFAVTGYAAALMVSGFSYLSLKQVDVDKKDASAGAKDFLSKNGLG